MYGQDKIMNILHENAVAAKNYIGFFEGLQQMGQSAQSPYEWFVLKTCTDWDYKFNSEWQVPYDYFNGEDMNYGTNKNWKAWIYFDGDIIGADKVGNINLGYVGTIMGYSGYMLQNDFTMDKDDGPYVQHGIDMANQGR